MLISLIWLIGFFTVFGLVAALLWGLIWWLKRESARRRSPLARNLLRNPGDSLRPELEDLSADTMGLCCLLIMMPVVVYSIWITQVHFGTETMTFRAVILLGVATIGVWIFLLLKLLKVLRRRRSLSLALDGEMAIGQELNQLMQKGCSVYHDFPAEQFNIDHVVISHGGVFAVETKARPKRITGDAKADAEVRYDGRTLQFPGWQSSEFLEQATRQAVWLSRWLSSAVGDKVEVQPVLALPGWFIKRTERGPVHVINGRDASYLIRAGDAKLSDSLVQRIVHQLEARCRTVEPRAYRVTLASGPRGIRRSNKQTRIDDA
jgi:Nuclease-related domain